MPPKRVPPAITLQAFSCPNCGALADQTWFNIFCDRAEKGQPPFIVTADKLKELRQNFQDAEPVAEILKRWAREATGEPFLAKRPQAKYADYDLTNIHVSRCYSCNDIAIWKYDTLLHPPTRYEIEPNEDLPEDMRADFNEARLILDLSPRGAAALLRLCIQKLCRHLGKPGKNINDDIAALVKDGLDVRVKQALDIVRVVGNEAVHPGTMDLRDNRETAAKLFDLVNRIAYDTISHPKELKALMASLPSDKVAAIAKRDGNSKP